MTQTPQDKPFNPEDTLDAKWVKDSETGERVLVDLRTNKVILRKGSNGEMQCQP